MVALASQTVSHTSTARGCLPKGRQALVMIFRWAVPCYLVFGSAFMAGVRRFRRNPRVTG
jgi:hypothetical protein